MEVSQAIRSRHTLKMFLHLAWPAWNMSLTILLSADSIWQKKVSQQRLKKVGEDLKAICIKADLY